MSLKFPSNGTQPNPQQKQPSSQIQTGIPNGLRWKSKQRVPVLPNVGLCLYQFLTLPWLYSWRPAQIYTSQTPSLSQCWLSSSPGILPAGNTAHGPIGDPSSMIHPVSASGLQQPPAQILPPPPALPGTPVIPNPRASQILVLLPHETSGRLASGEQQQQETPECQYQPWLHLLLAVNMGIRQSPGQDRIPVSNGHNYIS